VCDQQGLSVGLATSQRVDADLAAREIHLGADQAMAPRRRNWIAMPQEGREAVLVGTPQEDHRATQSCLQVQFPVAGKGLARRCRLDPRSRPFPAGGYKPLGVGHHVGQSREPEPSPDLALPTAVVALDVGLKAHLAGRHEHRRHPQRQTRSRDPAKCVRELVRPLKHRVVVELGVGGQSALAPVFQKRVERVFRDCSIGIGF